MKRVRSECTQDTGHSTGIYTGKQRCRSREKRDAEQEYNKRFYQIESGKPHAEQRPMAELSESHDAALALMEAFSLGLHSASLAVCRKLVARVLASAPHAAVRHRRRNARQPKQMRRRPRP